MRNNILEATRLLGGSGARKPLNEELINNPDIAELKDAFYEGDSPAIVKILSNADKDLQADLHHIGLDAKKEIKIFEQIDRLYSQSKMGAVL